MPKKAASHKKPVVLGPDAFAAAPPPPVPVVPPPAAALMAVAAVDAPAAAAGPVPDPEAAPPAAPVPVPVAPPAAHAEGPAMDALSIAGRESELLAQQQAAIAQTEAARVAALQLDRWTALDPATRIAFLRSLDDAPMPPAQAVVGPAVSVHVVGELEWSIGQRTLDIFVTIANHALERLDVNGHPVPHANKLIALHPGVLTLLLDPQAPNAISHPHEALVYLTLRSNQQVFTHPQSSRPSGRAPSTQRIPHPHYPSAVCRALALTDKFLGSVFTPHAHPPSRISPCQTASSTGSR